MELYPVAYAKTGSFPVGSYPPIYYPPRTIGGPMAAVDLRRYPAAPPPPLPQPPQLALTYTPQARKLAQQQLGSDSDRGSPTQSLGGSAHTTPRSPPIVNYRHNPYSALAPIQVLDESAFDRAGELALPAATIHKKLIGLVEFVAYPIVRPSSPAPTPKTKDGLTRLFLGQLPYRVTDEQLQWMCSLFCEANAYFPERITREDRFGARQLTGCVHLYTDAASADTLLKSLHKRVLFDNTGVWYARDAEQVANLSEYCERLRADKSLRPAKMPYTAVCAQKAHSTFVPTEEWSSNLGRVM